MKIQVGDIIEVKTLLRPICWNRATVTKTERDPYRTGGDDMVFFDYVTGTAEGNYGQRWINRQNVRHVPPLILLAEIAE